MQIKSIKINHFRNLKHIQLESCANFNLIFGHNGAGKSSILESIYYLGMGRSFRATNLDLLIQHQSNHLLVYAELDQNPHTTSIGIQRNKSAQTQIKINGNNAKNRAEQIKSLPLIYIDTHNYTFLHTGPKSRRQLLDWGVFHVKHDFSSDWRDFNKVLLQRNQALKNKETKDRVSAWDNLFCEKSIAVHQSRSSYLNEIMPIFKKICRNLLETIDIDIKYHCGWSDQQELGELLMANYSKERMVCYTEYGAHRADINFYIGEHKANDVLSQGQKKLLAYAFQLAQGERLRQHCGTSPLYLIDDLPSQLDLNKQALIAKSITDLDAQIFISSISEDILHQSFFHNHQSITLEQGEIHQTTYMT